MPDSLEFSRHRMNSSPAGNPSLEKLKLGYNGNASADSESVAHSTINGSRGRESVAVLFH